MHRQECSTWRAIFYWFLRSLFDKSDPQHCSYAFCLYQISTKLFKSTGLASIATFTEFAWWGCWRSLFFVYTLWREINLQPWHAMEICEKKIKLTPSNVNSSLQRGQMESSSLLRNIDCIRRMSSASSVITFLLPMNSHDAAPAEVVAAVC